MASALVLIFLGLFILLGCLAPLYAKMRERTQLYDLLRQGQEHNQPVSPEIVRELAPFKPIAPTPTREKDIRRGAILLALALGLALPSALVIPRMDAGYEAWQLIFLPVSVLACLGLVFLGLGLSKRQA